MIESGALDLTIVIPAYNEALRLPRTLEALRAWSPAIVDNVLVIVVNDGSTDSTSEVVKDYAFCTLIDLPRNFGKGYAVREGMLAAKTPLILMMDADLATPLSEFDKLYAMISQGYDIAIGSRPLASSNLAVRQPILREGAGRVFNVLVRIISGLPFYDTQCGFKLWTNLSARKTFRHCKIQGFAYDVESLHVATTLGFKIAETGVEWAHQPGAAAFSSPLSYLLHARRMLGDTLKVRWNHRALHRYSD